MTSEIKDIIELIKKFRDERDWEKFHDAKNLAICLNTEASELLETYLWKNNGEEDVKNVERELADVFYSALLLLDKYQLDLKEIILNKLKENEIKYPVNKSIGSNKKHNEL